MALAAVTYTSTAGGGASSTGLNFAQNALDLMVYMSLRSQLHYDAVADVKPSNQSFPGSSVTFTMMNDLAISTTALSESTDVTPVALSNAQLVLSLQEFGNAVTTTALGRGTSWTDLDSVVTNVLGYNAGVSLDAMAQLTLQSAQQQQNAGATASTPVAGTTPGALTAASLLNPFDIRTAVAKMRTNMVPDFGGHYIGFIHPDSSYDFRNTTTTAGWSDPHAYSAPENIWNGEIGAFGGVKFIETARAPFYFTGATSGGTTPYTQTLILGRQALAKAYSYVDGNGDYPTLVAGPVVDSLRRLVPFGWYWLGAYGLFRQQSIIAINAATSLATTTITPAQPAGQLGVAAPNPKPLTGANPANSEFLSPQSGPTVPGQTRTAG